MILSATLFSVMSAFIKLSGDLPFMEKALFRNLVSLIIAFSILKKKKISLWGDRKNRKMLILRSLAGSLGIISYFYSIDRLILADSSMLNKLSPFFVVLFAWIFLKTKIKIFQILSLSMALIGSLLIIKPGFHFSSTFPAIVGLGSAVVAGLAYVIVSYLGDKESSYTIVFYFSFVSTIVCFPFIFIDSVIPSPVQVMLLLCAGIAAAGGQIFLTLSYKNAPPVEVSIYQYSQIVASGILGIFLFAELPDTYSLIGYLLIFTGGYVMYILGKKESRKLREVEVND